MGDEDCCFGLLTLVFDLANSNRIGWGKSGSNRTPCKSNLAASAPALVEKVTKPTGCILVVVVVVVLY